MGMRSLSNTIIIYDLFALAVLSALNAELSKIPEKIRSRNNGREITEVYVVPLVQLQKVLKEASRLYAASWVRDIGPDLQPNDYKKYKDEEVKTHEVNSAAKEKEPSSLEDLGGQL
ncbi:hypothetical protein Scep_016324 [Stephania cephalantha]|uniref:Uncharacterized protein n=1 Tax=Stephania cephalantha TaxID=152367 RepID=A0AAP0IP65_9MAGN